MLSHQRTNRLNMALFAAAGLLLIVAGCSKNASTPSSSGAGASSGSASSGEALFNANGCGRCHALNGTGGGRGPDLTHVGADPSHTAAWIADQIKNPKSHNPASRMPAYQGRMSDPDIQTLSDYLAGLK